MRAVRPRLWYRLSLATAANDLPVGVLPWRKTTLHTFTFGPDGANPNGALISIRRETLPHLQSSERQTALGSVWELSPSNGRWTFNVIYDFPQSGNAGAPNGGVIFDAQGNFWGVGGYGGAFNCGDPQLPDYCGMIYELDPVLFLVGRRELRLD